MKKLLKLFSVLVIMLGVVFTLVGCGDDDETSSSSKKKDKESNNTTTEIITSIDSDNMVTGKMNDNQGTSKIEMSFDKNDKLERMIISFEFDNKEDADELYESSQDEIKGTEIQVVQQGKKVSIVFKAADFAKKYGVDSSNLDKETMKSFATYMGYTLD